MSICQLSVPPPIAPIKRTLHRLDLQRNNITHLPEDYFTGCQVLYTLQLSCNQLTAVPDVQILNTTLRNLLLTNNMITHIESLFFVPMIMLNTLDLARNLLTGIEFNNAIWPSIRSICLDNNHLTFIKTANLKVSGNVVVTVRGNPWHCDIKLCWMSRCQYNMGKREAFWSNCPGSWMIRLVGDLVCSSPEERKNIAIKESGKNSCWWLNARLK